MRKIVLDTETTGLETSQGHRIIEIGCVELIDRRVTDNSWHYYINPEREVDIGAFEVHGISNEFLQDKPLFNEIAHDFMQYIDGAELVIHNAAFDLGFLNHELAKLEGQTLSVDSVCTILDTLVLARQKHPGQKNNLDALCRRYDIDNSHRSVHGALLDARILADVYLFMTGGQTDLVLDDSNSPQTATNNAAGVVIKRNGALPIWQGDSHSEQAHTEYLKFLATECEDMPTWKV